MKITVLYNRVHALPFGRPEEILADEDTVQTARAVADSLVSLGHDVSLFNVNPKTISSMPKISTDFFFNLAEGIGNLPDSEFEVIAILEKTCLPFSGSGSKALQLTTDKGRTKQLLLSHHLPTPAFQITNGQNPLAKNFHFPLVVKPIAKDGSVGINGHSVLETAADVSDQVDFLVKTYQEPALVEEYIDGRELNVTVLGDGEKATVLPVSEIIFGPSFAGKFRMVDFPAKWEENTLAYKETTGVCPAKLDKKTLVDITRLSLETAKLTGCRNYSRIDFRLAPDKNLYILEVNANPGLAPDSGVVRSAKAAGYSFAKLLREIIDLALEGFYA